MHEEYPQIGSTTANFDVERLERAKAEQIPQREDINTDGGPAGQASPIAGELTGALIGGDPNAGARMISQRECCAQHELRQEALRYALDALRGTYTNAGQVVKDARIFEAFLKGDDNA